MTKIGLCKFCNRLLWISEKSDTSGPYTTPRIYQKPADQFCENNHADGDYNLIVDTDK